MTIALISCSAHPPKGPNFTRLVPRDLASTLFFKFLSKIHKTGFWRTVFFDLRAAGTFIGCVAQSLDPHECPLWRAIEIRAFWEP